MRQARFLRLALTLTFLAPVPALAQNGSSPSVGVKGAPLFAQLSQGDIKWQSRKGVVGGVSLGGTREGRFALVTEVLYARRGASNLGAHANLSVLEFPVLLRINIGRSRPGGVQPFGLAGAALDVNLPSAAQRLSRLNRLDPNMVVGAGVAIQRMTLEARQNIGLRSLAPNSPGLKSRAFSFMVGYRIR